MKEYEQRATKMIMSTVEGVKAQIRKAYNKGYEDGQKEILANAMIYDHEEAEKKVYNRGLNDAWEVVRKIIEDVVDGGYSSDVSREIFGVSTVQSIFKLNTVTEAIAKIKAYEDKQKQDAEIKVGDEIVYSDGIKGVVVGISNTVGQISVLNNKYDVPQLLVKNRAKKTGRTFPQIAEVLAELRGAENDK